MALWICKDCTAAYSVGAEKCPQCASTDYQEEHEAMPKITVHGGPSNAATDSEQPGATVEHTDSGPVTPVPDVTGDEVLADTEKTVEPDSSKDELVAGLIEDDAKRVAEPSAE